MSRRIFDYLKHTNLDLPHHKAFWNLVQDRLPEGFLDDGGEGRSVWVSAPAAKQPLALEPAYKLIKEFEGCHLQAYHCPAGVATIGWGNTRYENGDLVRMGDSITQERADALLRDTVERRIIPTLERTIPYWTQMKPEQHAALISFSFNLGWNWYGGADFRTLSRVLEQRQWGEVPEALLLYRNPGSQFEAGLRRRREAEGKMWASALQIEMQQPGRVWPTDPFSKRLTPHIRLGEFALDREERRFHHQHQVHTAAELAAFLERVRAQFGGRPIIITSGYRPPTINRAVGGASGSEHLYSEPGVGAVDFVVQGANMHNVQHWCDREWPYSLGYGADRGFVHLGIRKGRPRLRWPY